MVAYAKTPAVTPQQYLERERTAETKSEYYNGVIVAQDRPLIQVYERQSDDSWLYSLHQGLEATLLLTAIGCQLRLADVYARVEFRQADEDEHPT